MSANPNQEHALELKAGIFVLIGLVFIAIMAFKFGRLGQGLFQQYYPLTVTFPSADGLIKNSDVQLAGARVGYVAEKPAIASGGSGVTIPLEILSNVKIPRQTTFEVGSSGLLGDKFVDIKAKSKPEFDAATFNPNDPRQVLAPGETIEGEAAGGPLGALGTKADEVFDELKIEIEKLTEVTNKINTGILSTENQHNLSDTLTNLKGTSDHFNVASKDLDSVVLNAKGAVDSAKQTLGTVNAAADDVRITITDAQKTLDSVRDLLAKAQTGNGPIATLLNDGQMSANLKALVANLREHGILFYKNKPGPATAAPTPEGRLERQY
jgi:ABC-type transporter Mla subunit MlaD